MQINELNGRNINIFKRYDRVIKKALKVNEKSETTFYNIFDSPYERLLNKNKAIVQDGEDVLDFFREVVSSFSRSMQQMHVEELYVQSLIPFIYGDEYKENEANIKKENFIEFIKSYTMAELSRRNGKSYSVGHLVSAALRCVPNIEIILIAPAIRQAVMLRKKYVEPMFFNEVLKRFPCDWKRGPNNSEEFIVIIDGTPRSLVVLPAIERTTRGLGANVIILEEAAQMDVSFIMKVVMPVIQVGSTSLIAISTITDEDNYYTKMLDMSDRMGNPLFTVYRYSSVCDDCRESGDSKTCRHKRHLNPPWIDSDKRDTSIYAMEQLGFGKIVEAEMYGNASKNGEEAFPPRITKRLFDQKRKAFDISKMNNEPSHVFISIDPNGGGASDFALCSGFYDEVNTFVVCGLEAIPAKREIHFNQFGAKHIMELRKQFKKTQFIIMFEGNLKYTASNSIDYLTKYDKNIAVMRKDGLNTSGVKYANGEDSDLKTYNSIKLAMYDELKRCLEFDKVIFSSTFISTYNDNCKLRIGTCDMIKTTGEQKRAIKNILKRQLNGYRKIYNKPKDETLRSTIKFSGKVGGMQDDLCISLQLGVYWSRMFINNEDIFGKYIV